MTNKQKYFIGDRVYFMEFSSVEAEEGVIDSVFVANDMIFYRFADVRLFGDGVSQDRISKSIADLRSMICESFDSDRVDNIKRCNQQNKELCDRESEALKAFDDTYGESK